MDDHLIELASRYVDGDLDAEAAARLEQRAASDRELAETIASFRRLRASVASYADRLRPPAELDAVMEPLSRAAEAPRRHVRPAFRWLATAAVVVLGVTVGVEVARRNPEPAAPDRSPHGRAPEPDRGIFELAPLPSAVATGDRAVGATDRLLEERPTEPPVPEPPPLEVIGPLSVEADRVPARDEPPTAVSQRQKASAAPQASSAGDQLRDRVRVDAPAEVSSKIDRQRAAGIGSAPKVAPSAATPNDGSVTRRGNGATVELERQATERPAVLIVDGRRIWSGSVVACPEGRLSVVLELRAGRLVAVRPTSDADETTAAATCAAKQLVGLAIDGLGDGELAAEL
ncbi:MAG: hypothetical protein PVG53_15020, partial [Holophagae bacterium]